MDLLKKHVQKSVFSLILVVGFGAFGNMLDGPFLLDDEHFVVRNTFIRSWDYVGDIFTSDIDRGASLSSNFYRPLQLLVYMAIYGLFGLNSVAFHMGPLFFHLLNAFLIYRLLLTFKIDTTFSVLGALFFLLHPVQVEAVSCISGIDNSLGLFFCLLGVLTYLRYAQEEEGWAPKLRLPAVFIFYALALMSREATIVFPGLIFALDLYYRRGNSLKSLQPLVGKYFVLAAMAGGYLYWRGSILPLNKLGLWEESNIYTESIFVRLLSFSGALWEYFKLLVFPYHLYYEKPLLVFTSVGHFPVLFGIALAVGGLIASLWLYLREKRIFLFGFMWFFICFIPVSGIIPVNAIFLEHWLYYPIVGLTVLLFSLLSSIPRHLGKKPLRLPTIIMAILLLGGYGARDILRNAEWSSAVRFYENELAHSPNSARFTNNLAMVYADQNKIDKAIENYRRAITLYDNYPQTHHNLARALLRKNRVREAVDEFYLALKMDPNFIYTHMALQSVFLHIKDHAMAKWHQRLAEKINAGERITFDEIEAGISR